MSKIYFKLASISKNGSSNFQGFTVVDHLDQNDSNINSLKDSLNIIIDCFISFIMSFSNLKHL